jgi:hypothetical protein
MTGFLDRLNLRPQERRLVVVAAAVVFVVLNVVFVWPHFSDWGRAMEDLRKAKKRQADFAREADTNRINSLQTRLRQLEGQGSAILPSEQSLDLISSIQSQAAQNGVQINSQSEFKITGSTRTNAYFEEKGRIINALTGERELVGFLVSLASTNSIIRVLSMKLMPEDTINRFRLKADITLVASYQKNRPQRTEPAGAAKMRMLPPGSRNLSTNKP